MINKEKKISKTCGDTLEAYIRQIKPFPLLTFEEELDLSKQIQKGDNDTAKLHALHKLINSNLQLVVKIAGFYNTPEVPFLDMIQEGNLGLIRAAEKYDHKRNVRFSTYAGWWIRKFIKQFISNKRRIVRLPRQKEETLRKIQRIYHSLCQTLMHQPKNLEIAEELGISVQDVDFITNIAAGPLPLEADIGKDTAAGAIDTHEDYTYNPEIYLLKQFSRDDTLRILGNLKEQEKRVLSYRYQLDGCEYRTLREIGTKLNISRETVRQIEKRALKKIRNHAGELKESLYVEAI